MIDFSQTADRIQEMVSGFVASLPNVLLAILVFFAFFGLGRFAPALILRLTKRYNRQVNLAIVLGRLVKWAIWLLGLLVGVVIVFPDISAGQLFELLGVGSVALGFAFRDILQNFFAGLLILAGEPFRIGDQIVIDSFEGTVEMIETRATTLRTYDGRRVVIPNTQMFTNPVTVNTAFEIRRVQYDIGVGYEDDLERTKEVIVGALSGLDGVLKEPPPQVIVVELGDFSVNLRVRWWIRPSLRSEMIDTRDKVLAALKQDLEAAGVEMPFPTQQVLLQTVEADNTQDASEEPDAINTKPVKTG